MNLDRIAWAYPALEALHVLGIAMLFGSLLDRALVPSTQAMLPWLLLALFPLCSALALNVICRPLRS